MSQTIIARQPLVSVIIPTYNRAKVIGASLQSVLEQLYSNLEILIVDDASTDDTRGVIETFDDPRIVYIVHSCNKGGSAARNTGIDAARGEYIAFLDSDDAWFPNKISAQVTAILACPQPRQTVAYSQIAALKEMPEALDDKLRQDCEVLRAPMHEKSESNRLSDYLFCDEGLLHTSTIFLYASLARQVMFDERLKKHQDYGFCLKLEKNGSRFLFVEEVLAICNHGSELVHIGALNDYRKSVDFLDEYHVYFSPQASLAFISRKIFRTTARDVDLLLVGSPISNDPEAIKDLSFLFGRNGPVRKVNRLQKTLSKLYGAFMAEQFFAHKHLVPRYALASQLSILIGRELLGRARSAEPLKQTSLVFRFYAYLWAANYLWCKLITRLRR